MTKAPSQKSRAEERFAEVWATGGLSRAPHREYQFTPDRRWRFDFAWPEVKLALEVEGRGRHQTPAGERADCVKYNTAVSLGWRVLRYPASSIQSRTAQVVDEVASIICGLELICTAIE